MDPFLQQGLYLFNEKAFQSSEFLSFFSIEAGISTANSLVLLGDSLMAKKEYKRAIEAYERAYKLLPTKSANEIIPKLGISYSAVKENQQALLKMLKYKGPRKLDFSALLGKVYRELGNKRSAIKQYKECLSKCPYKIESILALAELGVAAKEITSFLPQACNARSENDIATLEYCIGNYARAACCFAAHDYTGGLVQLEAILVHFPEQPSILLEVAKANAIAGDLKEAVFHFEKARSVDRHLIQYMDEYALILKMQADEDQLHLPLQKLVKELNAINPEQTETIVATSMLLEIENDLQNALLFADKGIQSNPRHLLGYFIKGNILLRMDKPESALGTFRKALTFGEDLRLYEGLAISYLKTSKHKKAVYAARRAKKIVPTSPSVQMILEELDFRSGK